MTQPSPPRHPRGRVVPRPWIAQPRPAVRPQWCVYCGMCSPTICCGQEHTAYTGEWLCAPCYTQLLEGPVLFAS
jgi:hypothetical protein